METTLDDPDHVQMARFRDIMAPAYKMSYLEEQMFAPGIPRNSTLQYPDSKK